MLLEYFQMIDRVESVDSDLKTLRARSVVPSKSPVFEGHFPGMPLLPTPESASKWTRTISTRKSTTHLPKSA